MKYIKLVDESSICLYQSAGTVDTYAVKGNKFISNLLNRMKSIMLESKGVGLAAPQVGKDIRIFIVDGTPIEGENCENFKKVFINATILEESGEEWGFNEGCLSIPNVREDVFRKQKIKIEYQDEDFNTHIEEYEGLIARVIQHEYDHIEGLLFTDKLSSFKKQLLKKKLLKISSGKLSFDYEMQYFKSSKKR